MKKTALYIIFMMAIVICGQHGAAAENKKIKIRSVTFEGNTVYSAHRLESLMLSRPSRFLAQSYFYPEVFADDIDNLAAFYRQNGYLDAHIADTMITIDSINRTAEIKINIDEGEPTRLEGITIFGNEFFPDSLLRPYIKLQKEQPIRRALIEDAVTVLLSKYAENGFLDASITPQVRVNDEVHLAVVDFTVKEGPQASIDSIIVRGNEKTKRKIIARELKFKPGEIVKYSRLIDSQRRLYLTGLFEGVFVRPVPSLSGNPARKDILIEIKEKESSEFGIMVGYGSIEKVRGRIELNTFNLSGTGRQAGTAVEANFIKQGITASFTEPWTFGTGWQTDLNTFGELRQEPGYHAGSYGGRLTIGRKFTRKTTATLSYRIENTNLTHVDITSEISKPDPRIRSLTLSFAFDTRDNLFDPSRGWYLNWSGELAGGFLRGTNTFARSTLVIKHFKSLGRNAIVGSALELGWMDTYRRSENIPLSERFYTGGPTSLRGFGYQLVGPLDDMGEPYGGKFKLIWNVLEIRHAIYKLFGAALFLDVGNVWPDFKDFKFNDMRADTGFGLRLNSPLGIARLDYALNLDRRSGEAKDKIYLGMGQAF